MGWDRPSLHGRVSTFSRDLRAGCRGGGRQGQVTDGEGDRGSIYKTGSDLVQATSQCFGFCHSKATSELDPHTPDSTPPAQ